MKNDNFSWKPMSEWKFFDGDNRKIALRSEAYKDDNRPDGIVVVDARVVALCVAANEWSEVRSLERTVEHVTHVTYGIQRVGVDGKWCLENNYMSEGERDEMFNTLVSQKRTVRKVKITTVTHETTEVEG